jgi:hypothetical protein
MNGSFIFCCRPKPAGVKHSGGERTRIRFAERGLTNVESSKYKPRLRQRRIFLD